MRSSVLVGTLLAAAVLLTACGEGSGSSIPGGTPFATPTPVGIETPPSGTNYLGVYVAINSPSGTIYTLEKLVGRKFAMNVHYQDWTGLFPSAAESGDLTNGRLPLESWDCGFSNADIVSGAEDPLIVTRAQAIRSFGHPVFMRYMWDMNQVASGTRTQCYDPATDNSDGTFSASEYVAAWKHIRAIFTQQGVTNVVWVWNVSANGVDPTAYYPGDSQVDWIGIDAFDTTGNGLAATLGPTYALIASHAKPTLVLTGEGAPGQPAFFQTAPTTLQSQFPLVRSLLYYDGATAPYFFSLSPSGVNAFTTMGALPFFSGFGSL